MIAAFGFAVMLLLTLCAAFVALGLLRLYAWSLDDRDSHVDSAYRAARLVAVSRAEVRRG